VIMSLLRKIVLAVAVTAALLAAFGFADDACNAEDVNCLDEGSSCKCDLFAVSVGDDSGESCDLKDTCAYPLHCINGTCEEDSRGDECNSDSECVAAEYGTRIIKCIKNKCVVQGSFNDSCTIDDHCSGDQKCEKDLCAGLNETAKCTVAESYNLFGDLFAYFQFRFECGADQTCVNGFCVAALALDDDCTNSSQCDVYSICNNGKCIDRWTVAEGDRCDEDTACENGLYCDKTEKVCKKGVKRQYIVCEKDDDCASYGNSSQCILCNADKGEKYCSDPHDVQPDCVSEMAAAFKCYRKNGCAPTPSSSLDTCAQLECTAETNAIFTCESLCENKKDMAGAKCLADIMLRYCPLLPTWLRIVIAFSILIVIIVVVFIAYGIFRCVRKKNEYTQLPSQPEN